MTRDIAENALAAFTDVVMRRGTVLLLLPLAIACSTMPIPIRFGAHQHRAPVVTFSNPDFADGDPMAGRHLFIDKQCIDCHRVAEDADLPRGARAIAGPLLSDLHRYAPKDLAVRITSRTTGEHEELFDKTMKDYAQPLTAHNLVDLVAYLRNPKPPGS